MKPLTHILAVSTVLIGATSAHAGGYGGFTHYERGFYLLGTPSHNDGNWYVVRDGCYVRHSRFRQQNRSAFRSTVRYSSDWKSNLVRALEKKKDHELFLRALRESGLQSPGASALGNASDYYGAAGGTSVYSYGYIPNADQGGTIYGVEAFAPNIGRVDIAGLLNQQMRLVERLSEGTNLANNAVSDRIGQLAKAQAEVAKIREAGKILIETVRAAQPQRIEVYRRETRRPDREATDKAAASAPAGEVEALTLARAQDVLNRSCAKCHGPEKAEANLDLTKFSSWTDEELALHGPKILARVTSRDQERMMPPLAGGVPPLGVGALRQLLRVIPE